MSGHLEQVLIIDDESLDLEAMRRILESEGFRVLAGANYDDARKLFDKHGQHIDLLITDVSLPGRTGVELAIDLLKRKRDLKILFISGYVGAEVIRLSGLPASDPHFLRKPFQAAELLNQVAAVLESSEPMHWLDPRIEEDRPDASNGK